MDIENNDSPSKNPVTQLVNKLTITLVSIL